MQPISEPSSNFRHPYRVLAQTVAAHSGWQQNDAGQVFDSSGTILTNSLEDLATIMRALGWFVPGSAAASGVMWHAMPGGEDESARRANDVHAMARRLGI